jgi:hypothetical protein
MKLREMARQPNRRAVGLRRTLAEAEPPKWLSIFGSRSVILEIIMTPAERQVPGSLEAANEGDD